jgi:hypothetical protein
VNFFISSRLNDSAIFSRISRISRFKFPVFFVFQFLRSLCSLRLNLCVFLAVLFLAVTRAPAADLVNYRVGDQATEDVATPVALEVIDPKATASLKFEEALKTPAIFDYYPDTAGVVGKRFLQVAAEAHSNFVAAVEGTFHSSKIGDEVINSADFGYLVTAFNIKSKVFPVTTDLAAEWAHGNDGQAILDRSSEVLHGSPFIRADELPEQFSVGETVRLAPMTDEKLTPEAAGQRGKLTLESEVITLTQAQNQLRKQFPADQQPYAHALAVFLRPNCAADAALTELIRSNATRHLMVAQHYDAGQIIVHKGEAVDAGMKAALEALSDRLTPSLLRQQIAAERTRAEQEEERAQTASLEAVQAGKLAEQAHNEVSQVRGESAAILAQVRNDHRNLRLFTWFGGGTIIILGVISWIVYRRTRRPAQTSMALAVVNPNNARDLTPHPGPLPFEGRGGTRTDMAAIAPQVAQAVHDAVMQEMGLQRRELMIAQQTATDEIARLVERLGNMQAPMQERLKAYEAEIERLENELVVRTEENRELLKMKVEMMRQHLEYERSRTIGSWQKGAVTN